MTSEQTAFLKWLVPLAISDMKRVRVLASLTIAQAIVESDWGRSELAVKANNLFGIKANSEWTGKIYNKLTGEVYDGVATKIIAGFRLYPTKEASVADHGNFLLRPYYTGAIGEKDYKKACFAISKYATQPKYPEILISTIEKYKLYEFDKEQPVKIYLSPSSQEKNAYATGNTVEEIVCNKITDALIPILVRHGLITKRNNPANTPYQHAMESNAWGAEYHIPIHTNAGSGQGTEVFCYNASNLTAKSTILSKNIYDEVSKLTPTSDRGLKTNQSFTEIIKTKAPCAYIEVEFHDSVSGSNWILNNINQIAEAIARGILKTLNITYKTLSYPLVKFGSTGTAVRDLQEKLNSFGYKIPVTSIFDLTTEAAVIHFQFKRNLTIDGIVGQNTWSIINA